MEIFGTQAPCVQKNTALKYTKTKGKNTMIKFIEIDALKTEGLQTREGLSLAVVKEYAELMKGGKKLPPLSVVRNAAGEMYLTDGYHRLAALRRIGSTMTDVEITEGEYSDALRAALKANAAHGLRRSNADKQNALKLAWEHRQELFGGEPSVRELAEQTAVSVFAAHTFINKQRVLENNTPSKSEGKKITRRAAEPQSGETGVVDRFGVPVPERLVGAFKQQRLMKMSRLIRGLVTEIESAKAAEDYAFARVSQSTMITMRNAASDLKAEAAWCVCRQCGGRGCRACSDFGVQTKMEYERNPSELKV